MLRCRFASQVRCPDVAVFALCFFDLGQVELELAAVQIMVARHSGLCSPQERVRNTSLTDIVLLPLGMTGTLLLTQEINVGTTLAVRAPIRAVPS
jgi:hypothetical protein